MTKRGGRRREKSGKHPIWFAPGLSRREVKTILQNPDHPSFARLAGGLLSATSEAGEVFSLMPREVLAKHYHRRIRRNVQRPMRPLADLLARAAGAVPGKRTRVCAKSAYADMVGKTLRSWRRKAGVGAQELAARMNVSRQWIHKIESGRSEITVGTLFRYAAALGGNVRLVFTQWHPPTTEVVGSPIREP